VTAGAFVPLNFIAVRMSTAFLHPRVLGSTSNLPGPMALTFVISLLAIALLYATLCKYELTAKHTRAQVRALRRRLEGDTGSVRGRSAAPNALPEGAGRPGAAQPETLGSSRFGAGSAPGTVG
jgi:heme exporter protein C